MTGKSDPKCWDGSERRQAERRSGNERRKATVSGLLFDCPYKPNPEGCILCDIRKRPTKERIEWLNQLTGVEIQHIIGFHDECLTKRQEQIKR